jgi:hypothetical protein
MKYSFECKSKYPKEGVCVHMIKSDDLGLCAKNNEFLCKEDWAKNLPWISKSSRDSFNNCRQAYYFRKVCGITIKPKFKSIPLKLGTVWDEFIEFRYNGVSFQDRFAEYIEELELGDIEVIKLRSMMRAYSALGIENEQGGEHQKKFDLITPHCVVNGIIDVAYDDHYEEHKFSGSPDWYSVPYNLADQLATYFLSDENYQYAVMKVARCPGLRLGKGETLEAYEDRVYGDIIKRPSYYFQGYSRVSNTYGRKYYRGEFEPLQSVIEDYDIVTQDLLHCAEQGWWYQRKTSCQKFGEPNQCEYLPICEAGTGIVDEDRYDIKERKVQDED